MFLYASRNNQSLHHFMYLWAVVAIGSRETAKVERVTRGPQMGNTVRCTYLPSYLY